MQRTSHRALLLSMDTVVWLSWNDLLLADYRIPGELSGTAVKQEEAKEPFEDAMPPIQLHLLQCLLPYPISNSLEDEWNRHDAAEDAILQYCDLLEGNPLRGGPRRETTNSAASDEPMAQPQDTPQVQDGVSTCEVEPSTVHGKPSRATKEYLGNSELPEACLSMLRE
ncbi:hypothetical protein CNMCM5878_005668 [Aspergillus fumigatiaffinis]|nr:hypothetical protein CNMCM5878_005668 [Aspergillus fumigatiaffinis]